MQAMNTEPGMMRRPRGRPHKVVNEENTPALSETEVEGLRELKNGVFCDESREYLYDRVEIENEDGGKKYEHRRRRLQFSGMPRLISVYTTEKRGHKSRDEETFYTVEFSKRLDIAPETFTEREINAGEWLAHWPGLAITAPKDRQFYADILKAQVMPFNLPVGRAKNETGWHQDTISHLWTYAFRDGRLLTTEPELSNPNIPIAGYNFTSSTHAQAWRESMEHAPGRATSGDTERLFSWLHTIDGQGRTALLCYGAYRSLLNTLERVEMVVMAVAADDLDARDGSSGAGKTTSIDFARGVDGPCPYKSEAESTFRGTVAGTETRVMHVHDTLISIADFHLPETPSESEYAKWASMVDSLVSSAADNAEIRPRATKTLDARRGATIGGLLVMDGEKLHPLLLSRLRRVALLFFRRGEIDATEIHAHWQEYQAIHTSTGHTILRAALASLNRDENAFRRKIRAQEGRYEQELLTRFQQEQPTFDSQIARSLAHNFARFVTGAYLAESATGAGGLVDSCLSLALAHFQEQARLLANGGPSTVTRDWLLQALHLMLHDHQAHMLDSQNKMLTESEHGLLERWGYRRGTHDDEWIPGGPHVGNLSPDGQECYFKATILQEQLKVRAAREKLKWTYTERTFADNLVRLEIATPEYDKQGQKTKSAQRPYIAGKRERRLVIAAALLDIDNQEEEETPGPDGTPPGAGQDKSQGQEHQPGQLHQGQAAQSPEEERQAAARALLDELTAGGCSLRLAALYLDRSQGGIWGIMVPDTWTDAAYQELETRVLALNYELCELVNEPGQEHQAALLPSASHHHVTSALSGESVSLPLTNEDDSRSKVLTLRNSVTPETLAFENNAGQKKSERKPFGVIFADVRAGQAITEQGAQFSFPPNCSLSTLLEHAIEAGPVNRVYVCGELPGDGSGPESYRAWLTDAAMMERYSTGRAGHTIDGGIPEKFVGRYQHRATPGYEGTLDIRCIAIWLGDDRDESGQELYSMEDARAALALVTQSLRGLFPLFRNMAGSPAGTFVKLWEQGNHIAKKQFPPLADTIRALIHQNAGQGRIEYHPEHCQGKIPGLYYYDGIFMYAALALGELPTELAAHDHLNEYAGYAPARYRITYRVPTDWQHIGPFMTKRAGADWRERDGWFYPGQEHQGQAFETWVDGAELDILIQHYATLPPAPGPGATKEDKAAYQHAKARAMEAGQAAAFSAWQVEIQERILFKPGRDSASAKPLVTIAQKMIEVREQLEKDSRQAGNQARAYLLARSAIRNILLHGIGAFNREGRASTYILLANDPAPAGYSSYAELDDGRRVYTVPESTEADFMTHPEIAAAIWARCRARMTKHALALPYGDIVAIRTDAIAVKSRQEHLEHGTKPGQLRRKWAVEKPLVGPASPEKFDLLQHKILGRK